MIILDTMVLSEPLKSEPEPAVIEWLDRQISSNLFVTAINQAEMEYGIWAMPQGKKRMQLQGAVTELFEVDFENRVLPFDSKAALMFGTSIAAVRQSHGKDAVKDMDGMIASIAISHDRCSFATRDRRPFELMGLTVIDPWTDQP